MASRHLGGKLLSFEPFQLILVRHGLTDWNEDGRLLGHSDVPLNERGLAQAKRVAAALADLPVRAVISSPQARARETATPIASAHGLDVTLENGVEEVWLTEEWIGKTVSELRGNDDLERLIEDPTHACDSIELAADVQRRVVATVDALESSRPGDTVVVVSHGDPIRLAIGHYIGLALEQFRSIALDNGSISMLRFNRRGPQLLVLNWKSDLAAVLDR